MSKMEQQHKTRAWVPDEQPLGREQSVIIMQISGGQHSEVMLGWV